MSATLSRGPADIEELAANTIRVLSMETVEKAKSGHPGLPMGCADIATVLFTKAMKFNPANPIWADRDRFVLSAGHGSVLLYTSLHLLGYAVSLDDLKSFRQWGSKAPGHPEFGETPGVETTTGPLGQGIGNAVGMALAERMLAARFNQPGFGIVDHFTYALCGDGDMMEGLSSEAASLAGHLQLGRLIVLYDDNTITIEGHTSLAMSEDVGLRFEAFGWHVQRIDGHDRQAVGMALAKAKAETGKPSLIVARTTIAKGSPNKAGTHDAHGSPLGPEEVAATKKNLGWTAPDFTVPEEVKPLFAAPGAAGRAKNQEWDRLFEAYRKAHPEKAVLWQRAMERGLPADLASKIPEFQPDEKGLATRVASGKVINAIKGALPELVGGSADLAPSNNTAMTGEADVGPGRYDGRNLHFGIREHAMGAVMNGMSLHGGFRVYGATFLIFSDYLRPTIRLASMMGLPNIYVFTHDSIFVGEDGPTHEPIEQIASLRAIPGLHVLRPADANATAAAWRLALERTDGPTALILTRQNLPICTDTAYGKGPERGGYILEWEAEPKGQPEIILIATGSEVPLAREAAKLLREKGIRPRVVDLFSWERFENQSEDYRRHVLPPRVHRRLAIEAGSPMGWDRYTGLEGRIWAIPRFGASAPMKVLAEKFGFTAQNIAKVAMEVLSR